MDKAENLTFIHKIQS